MVVSIERTLWQALLDLFDELDNYLPHTPAVTIESEDGDIEETFERDDLHRPLHSLNIPWNDHRSGLTFKYNLGEFIVCSLLLLLFKV